MIAKKFVLVFILVGFSYNALAQIDMELVKGKIINNYLHYLASKADKIKLLNEPKFINLDIPSGYEPFIELEMLDSSDQFLEKDSIVLFRFSGLGYAFKSVGDSIDVMGSNPYIIEESGFVVRSGFKPHSGLVGLDKRTNILYYLKGPLLLHDCQLITINNGLDSLSIMNYLSIRFFDANYSVEAIVEYSKGNEYCATVKLEESYMCLFFNKDRLTNYVEVDDRGGHFCRCLK